MSKLNGLAPERVFKYFEEICSIPHGSGDMKKISAYCMDFAAKHSLQAICDDAHNIIIFKPASKGYENSEPVILQGHLDMVCQKTEECGIDFNTDGLDIFTDGDFIKAKGTTLGADNGIAVAMIFAILESSDIHHPAIEAVFTTDEEIGMIGATALCTAPLSAKKMINLDSEEDDTVTVSCAGGSDFKAILPITRTEITAKETVITISGLCGGHSGIEINSGRVNASILMGRVLSHLDSFDIIDIGGGDKCNAIPNSCTVRLAAKNPEKLTATALSYLEVIKKEIYAREGGFTFSVNTCDNKQTLQIMDSASKNTLIRTLICVPNGVVEMSAEIEGLVETSLNLGILKTIEDSIVLGFALRSNKQSALDFLEERLNAFFSVIDFETRSSGHYPPWEYVSSSELQRIYKEAFLEQFGFEAKVEAIHAGLECGVFATKIAGLDCISIGPHLYDVHTTAEKLSISSTEKIFNLLLNILEKCK